MQCIRRTVLLNKSFIHITQQCLSVCFVYIVSKDKFDHITKASVTVENPLYDFKNFFFFRELFDLHIVFDVNKSKPDEWPSRLKCMLLYLFVMPCIQCAILERFVRPLKCQRYDEKMLNK